MNDVDDTVSDTLDDEDLEAEDLDEGEPTESDLAEADLPPDPATGEDVESIQELISKQEAGGDAEEAEEETPEPVVRGETADSPDHRVVPMQSSEFQCTNCFLVKHRSQLADPKKMRCRDCA